MPDQRELLRETFGFPEFRDGQQPVVDRLLAGKSVLAIFPTGGGKSLCYQLSALALDGLTLVVSPLIALMKDQLDFLKSRNIPAARLDSSLGLSEIRQVHAGLHAGTLKLLYVSPERLANERFLQTLRTLTISLLAVDEAHCISEWGHNFRPDYLKLAALAKDLRVGRVLALTATAPPNVAGQIAAAFGIDAADVVRTDFYRPNLTLHLTPCQPHQADELLVRRIADRPAGATIVYVTLQRTAEEVARQLAEQGAPAKAYHAGLDAEVRHAIQDWFMADPRAVVVATIAFGMGIDKANIRYVYHYNLPKSLENYAQEVGRAGRDGAASTCEVFVCPRDRIALENFVYGDTPTREAVQGVVADVLGRGEAFDVSPTELAGLYDIRPLVVETLLTYLELLGVIAATGPFYIEYKLQPHRTSAEILKDFDARRADFLKRVLSHANKAIKWLTLDVAAAAKATGEPRERIVAALNYLEEKGDLTLQVAGARQGYRLVDKARNVNALVEKLHTRFADRERRDIERLDAVLQLAEHAGCRTRRLASYFGDPHGPDCGHCDWCLGVRPGPLPAVEHRPLGTAEREMVRSLRTEGHTALASPRQLARFLCGLASPATSKARLTTKHSEFGRLAGVPFREVMGFIEVD
jgi:ATP-dependent DNA helicase RecQ